MMTIAPAPPSDAAQTAEWRSRAWGPKTPGGSCSLVHWPGEASSWAGGMGGGVNGDGISGGRVGRNAVSPVVGAVSFAGGGVVGGSGGLGEGGNEGGGSSGGGGGGGPTAWALRRYFLRRPRRRRDEGHRSDPRSARRVRRGLAACGPPLPVRARQPDVRPGAAGRWDAARVDRQARLPAHRASDGLPLGQRRELLPAWRGAAQDCCGLAALRAGGWRVPRFQRDPHRRRGARRSGPGLVAELHRMPLPARQQLRLL
mmetsp:Transcript_2994/g.7947  ORF Transcript_2994/g.7947 Transcript_2994/m.7947 type:complete len:257 (-) Transcript_2994:856-1626(-)